MADMIQSHLKVCLVSSPLGQQPRVARKKRFLTRSRRHSSEAARPVMVCETACFPVHWLCFLLRLALDSLLSPFGPALLPHWMQRPAGTQGHDLFYVQLHRRVLVQLLS